MSLKFQFVADASLLARADNKRRALGRAAIVGHIRLPRPSGRLCSQLHRHAFHQRNGDERLAASRSRIDRQGPEEHRPVGGEAFYRRHPFEIKTLSASPSPYALVHTADFLDIWLCRHGIPLDFE